MSAHPPRTDILCTFLDAEDTLPRTLDSLARQTEAAIRVWLVDDGSRDASARIAADRASADPRFTAVTSPVHGRGHALNHGASLGSAPFLAIMDADDLAHPRWIEDALAAMGRQEGIAAMGFGRQYLYGPAEPTWPTDAHETSRLEDVTARLGRTNPVCHSGSVIRRGAFQSVGGYDDGRTSNFDYDLWVRLAMARYRLANNSLVRVGKRYHAGQKFSHRPGFYRSSLEVQARAIRQVSRNPADWIPYLSRAVLFAFRSRRRAFAAGRHGR